MYLHGVGVQHQVLGGLLLVGVVPCLKIAPVSSSAAVSAA